MSALLEELGAHRRESAPAYERWFAQACAEGRPPDALLLDSGSDSERFFARTIPGPDGHTYWALKSFLFALNGGGHRHARWWWYERANGPQPRGTLGATCGESHCITPEHQRFVPWSEAQRRFTDEQMIGALQVVALRLGHTPTAVEYQRELGKPSREIISIRFGGWENAVRAAGLEPSPASVHRRGPEDCIAALRHLADYLGHPPTDTEFRQHGAVLRAAGLPPSSTTIRLYLGGWKQALKKAGLR